MSDGADSKWSDRGLPNWAPHQVTAAIALMRKCLPDLTASEIKGDVVHRFAVVPEVMEKERWLATRGNPSLLPTDDRIGN